MNNWYITSRRTIVEIPGARWLKRRLFGSGRRLPVAVPIRYPKARGAPPASNRAELRANYQASGLADAPETFVLYRIIGNDLPPRHSSGQSYRNLAFILEHEPPLAACEKRFVVNRIVDPDEERAVLRLLAKAGLPWMRIPFDRDEYRCTPWDIEGVPPEYAPWTERFSHLSDDSRGQVLMRLYRHKNNYVMNNNGARNAALREGKTKAKWVLPWDGNCFLSASAWNEIVAAVRAAPERPYFVVPMARITDNERILEGNFRPEAAEEPQIVFRRDTTSEFDPGYYYGRRPKVELFWRLGVPGNWDGWKLTPWDLPCPAYARDAGAHASAGWVARLSSGQAHLEVPGSEADSPAAMHRPIRDRGFARVEAVKRLLDELDDSVLASDVDCRRTVYIRSSAASAGEAAGAAVIERLREAAEEALFRGPYSVVDKQTLPPGGDRHDYWHPAPYYWPHPLRIPGLPYVRRDGRRVPGTVMYEPLSENYDRTRLQRLFDDTFSLTLAWSLYGDRRYAAHAAMLVRTWFLEPETAMNPHLGYAQVRWGHNRNLGSNSGIIEMKDLHYFLDAVRVLQSGGCLSGTEGERLRDWFAQYVHWLRTSSQGREERASMDNHGTYYDLQVTSIAAFLGDHRLVRETLRDSRSRMLQQIEASGMQPLEMRRTNTQHYCCFNLQGWIHLAQVADACGEDLWTFHGSDGRGIRRAMEWLLPHLGQSWPYPQSEAFDDDRFYPILHACVSRYGVPAGVDRARIPEATEVKPLFHPHDGIVPFWQLALSAGHAATADTCEGRFPGRNCE